MLNSVTFSNGMQSTNLLLKNMSLNMCLYLKIFTPHPATPKRSFPIWCMVELETLNRQELFILRQEKKRVKI